MLTATTSRSKKEEIKFIYAEEIFEDTEERHFPSKISF